MMDFAQKKKKKQQNLKKRFRVLGAFDWADALVWALVLAVLVFTFLFRTIGVEGASMLPTLCENDRLIVSHLFYTPKPGDIVVVITPEGELPAIIKRVIATEGQKVDIDFHSGEVTVDGEVLDEPYLLEKTQMKRDVDFPVTVPEGCLFVMGDNRNHSLDSRDSEVGMVDTKYILGKAVFRLFPFHTAGTLD